MAGRARGGKKESHASLQYDQEGFVAMKKLLGSSDLAKRLWVKDALERIPPKSLLLHLELLTLIDEPDTLSRLTGLKLMAQLPPSFLAPKIGPVLSMLDDADGDVRRAIIDVLRNAPAEALVDHAENIVSFASHPDWSVRISGLYACATLPSTALDPHVENIMGCLQDPVPSVRWTAVDVLKSLPPHQIASQAGKLIARLADTERYVRWAAMRAVTSIPLDAIKPLIESTMVQNLKSEQASATCMTAIAMCRLEPSLVLPHLSTLISLLRDEQSAVRWAVLHGLRKIPVKALVGSREKGELVRELGGRIMEDPDIWVRRAAARLLESLLSDESVSQDLKVVMEGIWSQGDGSEEEGGEDGRMMRQLDGRGGSSEEGGGGDREV